MYNSFRMNLLIRWVALSVLAACLAGCAGASPTAEPSAMPQQATALPLQPTATTEARQMPQRTFVVIDTPAPAETVIEVEVMKPMPQNAYIANLVQQAQQDLAKQLAVPVKRIEFISFEDVLWPDGSLGCPQPGMAYTQVLVEGYRIVLQFEGQSYAYHGGGNRPPFLCQNPQK